MFNVKLISITPNAEQVIGDCARVSNPANQGKDPVALMKYLVEHKHWSPFEMAQATLEIECTRDIARQILRHRSFSFQEFSQRYANVDRLGVSYVDTQVRLQDVKNRQNSIPTDDVDLQNWWSFQSHYIQRISQNVYAEAIKKGIAKEVARKVLPEGLTMSRLYMSGSIRSWMHYCQLRTGHGTQMEHQDVAQACSAILAKELPNIWSMI